MNTPHLPKILKIAAFDFKIEPFHRLAAMAVSRYGEMSSVEMIIRIDYDADHWKVLDTVLHEILHAIYWAYGVAEGDKEERVVSIMGTAWAQVYRDNPDLVKWIADMCCGPSAT